MRILLLLATGAGLAGCAGESGNGAGDFFAERAAAAGLRFDHVIGELGNYYFPEMPGSGAALFDFDGDGDLDVYFVQSGDLSESTEHGDRLFRNDLVPGGRLNFVEVTGQLGIAGRAYGMGVAAADYDNDGDTDLYVTNFGANQLLRNDGGRFTDVTTESGTGDESWGTSAAFLDYDNDGLLDLYVANYVSYSLARNKECFAASGARDYCGPQTYSPAPDTLYRNLGDGSFADVSVAAGIRGVFGPGLGVIGSDFDRDADLDIYVANDQAANQLWNNNGDGTFADMALMSGAALNRDGQAEASMGVTAGDFDADGDEDLFMTHLDGQSNTLYVNDGSGNFTDATAVFGLSSLSLPFTGFGAEWFDVNNDGLLDLFIANGAVLIETSQVGVSDYPYEQRNQLFMQTPAGRFEEITGQAALDLPGVSRGAAFGDIDNDGDIDILVSNNNGPAHLLLNEVGNRNDWLTVKLVGKSVNRDALGSRVVVSREGLPDLWRRVHTDGSYLNANDPRVHFGLGSVGRVTTVTVYWHGGGAEQWRDIQANQFVTLTEGTGTPIAASGD